MKQLFAQIRAMLLCALMLLVLTACPSKSGDVLKGKWLTDFNEAKAGAKQMNRPILVYFGNSKNGKLEPGAAFTEYAGKNLILAYIDTACLSDNSIVPDAATAKLMKDFGITGETNISALLDTDGSTLLTVFSGDPSKYDLKQIDLAISNARSMKSLSDNLPATESELNNLFSFVPETLAVVDGIAIPKSKMIASFAGQGIPLRILQEIPKTELYKAAQQESSILVETAIMLKLAEQKGIKPTKELVKGLIDEANKSMTADDKTKLENEMKEQGQTLDEYIEQVTSDPETQRAAAIQQLVDIHYLKKFADAVTDQEILDYYEKNKKEYTVPENVTVAHILIAVNAGANDAEYATARKKIDEIYAKLQESPAKFGELAKEKSDCPSGKQAEGRLPAFYRNGQLSQGNGKMDSTFAAEAFKLEKAGEISKPFKTDFGWHIVKLLEKKEEFIRPLNDEGKAFLRKEIAEQKANEKLTEDIEAYKKTGTVTITPFPELPAEDTAKSSESK